MEFNFPFAFMQMCMQSHYVNNSYIYFFGQQLNVATKTTIDRFPKHTYSYIDFGVVKSKSIRIEIEILSKSRHMWTYVYIHTKYP